jgi:hypothetical protein
LKAIPIVIHKSAIDIPMEFDICVFEIPFTISCILVSPPDRPYVQENPYRSMDELNPPISKYFIAASFDLISLFVKLHGK